MAQQQQQQRDTSLHCNVQDVWEETESHSCLKRCMCPADGSACAPSAACDGAHFACKAGWQRFSDGQAKCFQPGCQAGSLHEAVGRSVPNGQAFAMCTCSGGAVPPPPSPPLTVEHCGPEMLSCSTIPCQHPASHSTSFGDDLLISPSRIQRHCAVF